MDIGAITGAYQGLKAAKEILQDFADGVLNTPQTKRDRMSEMLKEYNQYRNKTLDARLVRDGQDSYLKVTGLEELNG